MDQSNNRVIIENNGKITWMVRKILKTACSIDVSYFPFDTQVCAIKMGSWTNEKDIFGIDRISNLVKGMKYIAVVYVMIYIRTRSFVRRFSWNSLLELS